MKNKTPLILGGVFVVLFIVYLTTTLNPPENTKGAKPLFPGEKPRIDKVEFDSAEYGQIVIEEDNNVWNITAPIQYQASAAAVRQMTDALQDIVIDGVITENPDSYAEFAVDDSTGIALKAYSMGNLLLDAVIGKYNTRLTHTYVRRADSKDVELWRGVFSQFVKRDIDEWRDKGIFTFNAGEILSVKATDTIGTRELVRADSLWVFTENGKEKPIDQGKTIQLVAMIGSLRCDAFADEMDIPRAASTKPDMKVSFKVRNGEEYSFEVWSPSDDDQGRYLVRTGEGGEIFRFLRYRGSQLGIDYERIKPADAG